MSFNPDEYLERLQGLAEEEYAQALELLNELKELRESNPLWFYNHPTLAEKPPHEKQLLFHSLVAKAKFFFGGNQSGKTTAGLADDIIQAVPEELLPDHLKLYKKFHGPFHCRILAPSLQVLELVIYVKMQELMPKAEYQRGTWGSSFDKQLRVLTLKSGSTFQFMTYEQDYQKMGGVTINRIHYDEEPPRRHRIENRLRVMRHGGDEIFTMTPVEGLTWMSDEVWDERGEEVSKGVYVNDSNNTGIVVVDMDDNPYLSEKEKEIALQGLSSEERQARKSGQFVALTGLIYQDFKKDLHVLPYEQLLNEDNAPELPPNSNVYVGIDPGMRNRAAVLFSYMQPDGSLYIFDELYEQGKTVADIAEMYHKILAQYQVFPTWNVIDPAARNKNHQTGRSDQMEYMDHGINTIPGQNSVEAGINRVREKLQNGQLFIYDNCTNLIRETTKYRWKEPPRTGEDGRPVPTKKDDHALDALRYIVMSLPYAPRVTELDTRTELQKAMERDQARFARPEPESEFGAIYR
jgi:phage terminase large subunit-like protein